MPLPPPCILPGACAWGGSNVRALATIFRNCGRIIPVHGFSLSCELLKPSRLLLRALMASLLLHGVALFSVRLPYRDAEPGARVGLRARLVSRAEPLSLPVGVVKPPKPQGLVMPSAPKALPEKPERIVSARARAPRVPDARREMPLAGLAVEALQSSSLPLSPELAGVMRGFRIDLALVLGAEVPAHGERCRATARLSYWPGGQLAALRLSDSDCSPAIEQWIYARLNRAVATARVPEGLQAFALELELPLELDAD